MNRSAKVKTSLLTCALAMGLTVPPAFAADAP